METQPSAMSPVSMCPRTNAARDPGNKGRAGTVTIGSVSTRGETFPAGGNHAGQVYQGTFANARKMRNCDCNEDLACMAGIILIGDVECKANGCITCSNGAGE